MSEFDSKQAKGVMSVYAFFIQAEREEFEKKNPGKSIIFADFSRKCSEKWKLMTEEEKKYYQNLTRQAEERHEKELDKYLLEKKKTEIYTQYGKRNAYGHFRKKLEDEFVKENPDKEQLFKEFSKSLYNKWTLMTEEEKKPFQVLADRDEKLYKEKMKHKKELGDFDEESDYEDNQNEYYETKLRVKPISAFSLFANDIRSKVKEELPNATLGDIAKKIAELWFNSSSEEKLKYEVIAKKELEAYYKKN